MFNFVPITDRDVTELRDAYRLARSEIDKIPDRWERDIGYATLRNEATAIYRQLVSTAHGLPDSTVKILEDYIAALDGGQTVERLVNSFDSRAEQVMRSVVSQLTAFLMTGVIGGAALAIIGFFANAALVARAIGGSIAATVIAGGGTALYLLQRTVQEGSRGLNTMWYERWAWANNLGRQADHILQPATVIQQRLWTQAGGGPPRFSRFSERVRSRARLMVGLMFFFIGTALLLVAFGAIEYFSPAL